MDATAAASPMVDTIPFSTPSLLNTTQDEAHIHSVPSTMPLYVSNALAALRNESLKYQCTTVGVWNWNTSGIDFIGQLPPKLTDLTATDRAKVALYSFLSIMGLVGNVLVICLVVKNRRLWKSLNYYLVNLAVADIFISLVCMWIHLVDHLSKSPWILGRFLCRTSGFIQMTALTSSTLTLTAISADRYLAVKFPLRARTTHRDCKKFLLIIWLAAVLASTPFLVFRDMVTVKWKGYEEHICIDTWPREIRFRENGACFFEPTWQRAYYTAISVAMFFLPLLVMGVSYSLIGLHIWKSRVPGSAESSTEATLASDSLREAVKMKVIRMVIIVMVVFCVCWAPLQFVNLFAMWTTGRNTLSPWYDIVVFCSYCLAYANSAINPALYGGLDATFREAAMRNFSMALTTWRATAPDSPAPLPGRRTIIRVDDTPV